MESHQCNLSLVLYLILTWWSAVFINNLLNSLANQKAFYNKVCFKSQSQNQKCVYKLIEKFPINVEFEMTHRILWSTKAQLAKHFENIVVDDIERQTKIRSLLALICIYLCSCCFSQLFTFQQQFKRKILSYFLSMVLGKSLNWKMLLLQLFNWKMISPEKRESVSINVSPWQWASSWEFFEFSRTKKITTSFRITTEHIFSHLALRLHGWQAVR